MAVEIKQRQTDAEGTLREKLQTDRVTTSDQQADKEKTAGGGGAEEEEESAGR